MSNSLRFYQDAGMTVPFALISATQADSGGAAPVDRVAYLGSPVAGLMFQAESDPGVDQIVLAVVDSLSGLQIPATSVKLALSSGGLAGATAGAALNLGTEILSGNGNALPVHVRIDAAAIAAGLYDNLSLETSSTIEVAA